MTFEFHNFTDALTCYTDENRWGTPSGWWCCENDGTCYVVQTKNYLPINIWVLDNGQRSYSECLQTIETALWEIDGVDLNEFKVHIGYGKEAYADWPPQVYRLVRSFFDWGSAITSLHLWDIRLEQ